MTWGQTGTFFLGVPRGSASDSLVSFKTENKSDEQFLPQRKGDEDLVFFQRTFLAKLEIIQRMYLHTFILVWIVTCSDGNKLNFEGTLRCRIGVSTHAQNKECILKYFIFCIMEKQAYEITTRWSNRYIFFIVAHEWHG